MGLVYDSNILSSLSRSIIVGREVSSFRLVIGSSLIIIPRGSNVSKLGLVIELTFALFLKMLWLCELLWYCDY